MKYIVTINGKNYEVEVERGHATIVKTTETAEKVYVSQPATVPAQPVTPTQATSATNQVTSGDGEPVKSPMPGMILDVRVSAGAAVKKGDILFILEAMKMENEITAPENGLITAVSIAKGTSVSTGDVLAFLKT